MKRILDTLFLLIVVLCYINNLYSASALCSILKYSPSFQIVGSSQNINWTATVQDKTQAKATPSGINKPAQPDVRSNFRNTDTSFHFIPTTELGVIEWSKFPEFDLPFTIVWQGPHLRDSTFALFNHGFSHMSVYHDPSFHYAPMIPVQNRALLWANVAYYVWPAQPWSTILSPWSNDTTSTTSAYKYWWKDILKFYADYLNPSGTDSMPNVDFICADIEAKEHPAYIHTIKGDTLIPDAINLLPDDQFIHQYKTDMAKLYNSPLNYFRNHNPYPNMKVSCYSEDAPIFIFTLYDFINHSWNDWITDSTLLNYVATDQNTHQFTPFYNNCDLVTPSPYFWKNYAQTNEENYLAYLLFTIEVNAAWTTKDIVPFVWLRYRDTGEFIEPTMAEAVAIFPYFSGAKGTWLYGEHNNSQVADTTCLAIWEYYINGLYRLSQHKHMFEGTYQVYIPKPAHTTLENAVFNSIEEPIWRGIVNGSKILIAAQNPYNTISSKPTRIPVSYPGYPDWSDTIELHGKEVFLKEFDMLTTSVNHPTIDADEYKVFPNPASNLILIQQKQYDASAFPPVVVIYDINGKIITKKNLLSEITTMDISYLSKGVYIIQIDDSKKPFVRQFNKK